MNQTSSEIAATLERLNRPGAKPARREFAPLLTTSGAATAAKDPRFSQVLDGFIDRIASDLPNRVSELALVWRLTSVTSMREHRRRIVERLNRGIREFDELPTAMSDPDDRRHFGHAMFHVGGGWVPQYLIRSIVAEKDGEKAREALSEALVAKLSDLSELLGLIAASFPDLRFEQQEPSVGRARRLATVLDALSKAVWSAEADVAPGDDFGSAIATLVKETLARRPTADRSVALLAVRSVTQFAVTAVRLHGTLAGEASTYAFLEPLKRSLGSSNWPEELAPELERLAGQVLDQLVFLVRLGMPDSELRRVYLLLLGEVAGKARLERASERSKGLDAEGARWLRMGTARRVLPTQSAIEETALSTVDRDLGLALREAELVRAGVAAVSSDVLSAAEFHSTKLAEEVRNLHERSDRLTAYVEGAARRRGLALRGVPGDVVDFSPIEHEPIDGAIGARSVRLRTKTIERLVDGRVLGVVVKGDVEAA